MRLKGSQHRQLRSIHKIDITPLMDLTFLLLIVFMISAPLMESAVDVTPPKLQGPSLLSEDAITLSLNTKDEMFLNGVRLSSEKLKESLRERIQKQPQLEVRVRADAHVVYQKVMDLVTLAKSAGAEKIVLVTLNE